MLTASSVRWEDMKHKGGDGVLKALRNGAAYFAYENMKWVFYGAEGVDTILIL